MSGKQPPELTKLVASAGAGVEIRIRDGRNELLDLGIGQVEVEAPEGLYAVEWVSAGVLSETLVKVTLAEGPVEVMFNPADVSAADLGPNSSWTSPGLVSQVGEQLRPSEQTYKSLIAVIVSADPGVVLHDAAEGIRILNNREKAMRANTEDRPELALSDQDIARSYRVRPGRYHLQFRSLLGETLQQSVPALPGRQTIIFLKAGKAELLVAEGGGFTQVPSVGIDPSRTVQISVEGYENDEWIRDRVRFATVLLHDLAVGGTSLSESFITILDKETADPLLKLYAAILVLARLEQRVSPVLDEPWPKGKKAASEFSARWAKHAAQWVAEPDAVGLPPDATTANWELFSAFPALKKAHRPKKLPQRIEVPPMLECSWRWAIEYSFERPEAVKGTASILAAGRSSAGAAPWLCWQASAAKAAPSLPTGKAEADAEKLLEEVAKKAQELLAARDWGSNPARLLEVLSPEVAATVLRFSNLPASSHDLPALRASDLARVMNVTATQLKRHLRNVRSDIEGVLRGLVDVPAPPASSDPKSFATKGTKRLPQPGASKRAKTAKSFDGAPRPAPGLARRITYADDPQKGRFGGEPSAGGFRLSAKFETKSSDWTRIILKLSGKAQDGEVVHFHIHDSFRPSMLKREFLGGKAELILTAWGGFTVGVWIPGKEVELELDLSEIARAPRNIKTR